MLSSKPVEAPLSFSGPNSRFIRLVSPAIERRQGRLQLLPQYPYSKVPIRVPNLIACVLSRTKTEDLIQFLFNRVSSHNTNAQNDSLKCHNLRLWHKQQHRHPTNNAPSDIPSQSALRLTCCQQVRARARQNEVETRRRGRGPTRTHFKHQHLQMQCQWFLAKGAWLQRKGG